MICFNILRFRQLLPFCLMRRLGQPGLRRGIEPFLLPRRIGQPGLRRGIERFLLSRRFGQPVLPLSRRIGQLARFSALALLLPSCNYTDLRPVVELGGKPEVVSLGAEAVAGGSFEVISNVAYNTAVVKGSEWLKITRAGGPVVEFDCYANNGFAREARVELSFAERRDTVSIRQQGRYLPFVQLLQDKLEIPASGGRRSIAFASNLPCAELSVRVSDSRLSIISVENNILSFELAPSSSMDSRKFTLSLYYENDWAEVTESVLTITQTPSE